MTSPTIDSSGEEFPWHLQLFDAHCHPTDTMSSIDLIPSMKTKVLTVMATRAQDQDLVAQVADGIGVSDLSSSLSEQWNKETRMIPCFGWHPWFSHQMFDSTAYDGKNKLDDDEKIEHYQSVLVPKSEDRDFLLAIPAPLPFSHFINETRKQLQKYPLALVGEIGLDKAFRIPESSLPDQTQRNESLTPGGREGRRLSPYRVSMDHQRKILTAQLSLAGELQRAVSVHGVQAHGVVLDTIKATWKGYEKKSPSKKQLKRDREVENTQARESSQILSPTPYPPRICLHSYSGPAETLNQYLHTSVPADIYFSFSLLVNFTTAAAKRAEEVIQNLPVDRILVESDLHTAGEELDYYIEQIVRKVCTIKGWSLEEGVTQLGKNWKRFVFGERDIDGGTLK
jgi:Tat protein secretion system quality control protein TatD with DNase activity